MRRLQYIVARLGVVGLPLCLLAGVRVDLGAQARSTSPNLVDPALYQALRYRMIGPHRGQRSTAVAGVASERETFYMGPAGGGIWKTIDGGETWLNTSDGYFKTGSIGAIAVAETDPNIVYVGTGSACIRGNVSPGIGMYKSSDAGQTWHHVGLNESGHVGRIRIHPTNPDLVYVAALGHAFGPNSERGVFRSKDGGKSWEKVLFINDRTGAIDIAMDPRNPRVLYAAMWMAERKPWSLVSGGPDGGVYKTTDAGNTWTKLTNGLPASITGRIGVAVASNSSRVWALVEAEEGGLFRSEDGGNTFERINRDRELQARPWYYMHIFADPVGTNTVYVGSSHLHKSTDGGRSFEPIAVPHGDQHDMWISPADPRVMIEANDGGANVSFNGGKSWSTQLNQPTAELYRVAVDNQFPYRVYGAQQDQYEAISLPSRSANFGAKLQLQYWEGVGGFEGGHVAVNLADPNIVYSGGVARLTRFDRRTLQVREIKPYPEVGGTAAKNLRYRYQWNNPMRLSPHDPSMLYTTSQHVHKSLDGGQSWTIISPDLTTNDKSKQDYSGGPITLDQTTVEIFCTIFAFEESPQKPGLLWAGTDDGLMHVSRDGGKNWENITPKGMPQWATVNMIDLSAHDTGRALIAVHRYRMDDFKPYIFRTDDYGKTWKLLTNGIPANHFVRVVREDPSRKGLLYAGTEFGMYISFDDGANWQAFQLNLPVVPITDMVVHQKDLVMSTQGRSFWILDDLTPLHQITDQVARSRAHLFKPRDTYRVQTSEEEADQPYVAGPQYVTNPRDPIGSARIERHRIGTDAPDGAIIYTYFAQAPEGEVRLEILDAGGKVVRGYSSRDNPKDPSVIARPESPWFKEESTFSKAGLNRFVWDLRYAGAHGRRGGGPKAVPGPYQVRVTAGSWSATQSFDLQKDPRVQATQADFQSQFDLLMQLQGKINEITAASDTIRDVRDQVRALIGRVGKTGDPKSLETAAIPLIEKLGTTERRLVSTDSDHLMKNLHQPPRLMAQFNFLSGYVDSADSKPTNSSFERFEELKGLLATELSGLQQAIDKELGAFNALIREKGIPPIIVPVPKKSVTSTSSIHARQ